MTTFSFAYGPELAPRVRARNLYRKIERQIESLDGVARQILDGMLAKEFGPDENAMYREMIMRRQAQSLLLGGQNPLQAAAQQNCLQAPSAGIYGGLL